MKINYLIKYMQFNFSGKMPISRTLESSAFYYAWPAKQRCITYNEDDKPKLYEGFAVLNSLKPIRGCHGEYTGLYDSDAYDTTTLLKISTLANHSSKDYIYFINLKYLDNITLDDNIVQIHLTWPNREVFTFIYEDAYNFLREFKMLNLKRYINFITEPTRTNLVWNLNKI